MANIWDLMLLYGALSQLNWAYMVHSHCPARPIHLYTRLCSSHCRENRHIAKKASIISTPRFCHQPRRPISATTSIHVALLQLARPPTSELLVEQAQGNAFSCHV